MSYSINKFNSSPKRSLRPKDTSVIPQFTQPDSLKQKVLSQNKALAKKNSILMTKVADLETKISDLIQENIELRAINAKGEDQKRKWLEDKINLIENGVSQRFEEMFHMFNIIRNNEGLSSTSVNFNNLIQMGPSSGTSERTVTFNDAKSPTKSYVSDRRRKSARRQSFYIAHPESPHQLEENRGEEHDVQEVEREEPTVEYQEHNAFDEQQFQDPGDQEIYNEELSFQEPLMEENFIPEEPEQEDVVETQQTKESHQDEIDHAVTLSPIKFSSPKRPESNPKFSVYMENETAHAKDAQELHDRIEKLVKDSVHISQNNTLKSDDLQVIEMDEFHDKTDSKIYQDVEKIKHTTSKSKKQKSSKDEIMPVPISSELSTRKSRTRGKSVNYAEPSLRKKMRRESEQLTDAVIDRRSSGIKDEPITRPQSTDEGVDNDLLKASRNSPIRLHTEKKTPMKKLPAPVVDSVLSEPEPETRPAPLLEKDSINVTKRRKPLSTLNQNKIQKKDPKPMKKMQLDIDAAELSVFDLVDECEVGVPKTYKGAPEVNVKRSAKKQTGSRRHSMLL